ncbi:MAG: GGDEF domain-containing protein [Sedimentisphaerales bacterium]|nr:GGDEF domain-containing protein [Sedimentisphaerales bacterium]
MKSPNSAWFNNPSSEVLIIGDPAGLQDLPLSMGSVRQSDGMLGAIQMASQQRFGTIVVVMSDLDAHLESSLTTLRRISNGSRIILLAQMAEEHRARQLVRSASCPNNVADEYFISPVKWDSIISVSPFYPKVCKSDQIPMIEADRIRQLERLATEDDLTGLKNRRYLREFLRQIVVLAGTEDMRVTLLLFDIDDFKHYNDAYGHTVGDDVLRQAAIMISRCCREHDVVARIGGDEFAVVFWDRPEGPVSGPGTAGQERRSAGQHPRQALFMAQRFREQISRSNLSVLGPEGKGSLTISGGLASFPADASNEGDLFQQADKALLEAKRSGKDRIVLVGTGEGSA